jgi:predicted amidohydrolase
MTDVSSLTVGVYQPRARDETPGDRLQRLAGALGQPAAGGCDLLVCPELYLSGYQVHDRISELAESADGPFARQVRELAQQAECAIVYGYPERDGETIYNSALCVGPDGDVLANHRKNLLPSDYEEHYFTRGAQPTSFTIRGWRVGLVVCYEVEFPEPVRYHAQHGCDLVVAPTALVDRWTVVARKVIPARAFESSVFVAYANHCGEENVSRYLGESVIVSPFGEDLARAGSDEALVMARVDRAQIADARERLRFLQDAGRSCYR